MTKQRLSIAVSNYKAISKKINKRLWAFDALVIADQLNIDLSASYEKRRGINRHFTYGEMQQLVELYGTPIEQAKIAEFQRVIHVLHPWLKAFCQWYFIKLSTSTGLTNGQLTRRRNYPDSWQLDELSRIGKYLDQQNNQWRFIDLSEPSNNPLSLAYPRVNRSLSAV